MTKSQKERQIQSPSRWPPGLIYSRQLDYTSVPPIVLQLIKNKGRGTLSNDRHAFLAPVVIRRVEVQGHPAFGQMGLFAAKKISPQSHIIDYIGEVHVDERPNSDYDISLARLRTQNIRDGNDSRSAEHVFNVGVRIAYDALLCSKCAETEQLLLWHA